MLRVAFCEMRGLDEQLGGPKSSVGLPWGRWSVLCPFPSDDVMKGGLVLTCSAEKVSKGPFLGSVVFIGS